LGSKNPVGKIVKTNLLLCIFCLCLMLSSCKNIEHVFIINKTSDTISIEVTLVTRESEQIMRVNIDPDKSDGWEFEENDEDKNILDKKLKNIVITNNKNCKKELQRGDILKLVEKSGAWTIIIDNEVLNCN